MQELPPSAWKNSPLFLDILEQGGFQEIGLVATVRSSLVAGFQRSNEAASRGCFQRWIEAASSLAAFGDRRPRRRYGHSKSCHEAAAFGGGEPHPKS